MQTSHTIAKGLRVAVILQNQVLYLIMDFPRQMLGAGDINYFFQQKRDRRFQQRRVRKYDEQAIYGVTFHIADRAEGDTASVFGGGAASVKSFASRGGLASKWGCPLL